MKTNSQANKANLGEKLMDLTIGSDDSANRKRATRGLTLSGIEESIAESSILHSLSETELHNRLDPNDLQFLR